MMIEYLNGLKSILNPMISRRRLLQLVIASGAVTVSGLLFVDTDIELPEQLSGLNLKNLSDKQLLIMSLFSTVILDGASIHSNQQYRAFLKRLDLVIGLLPYQQHEELKRLLDLLTSRLGQLLLTRHWKELSQVEQQQIDVLLTDWRDSSIALFNKAYRGLKEIIMACWYGGEQDWAAINYPGPPDIMR